jgi:RNA polymerase sigma-70 factor (ECF subfamily)
VPAEVDVASTGGGAAPGSGSSIVTGHGYPAAPVEPALSSGTEQPADEEIARFYSGNRKALHDFLVRGCGCASADAEDIIQDTIMAIRRRYWPTVRALDKPEAYWFKAAERRYRRLRGRQAGRIADGDPSERLLGVAHPGDQFAVVDRREALMAVLRELPPRQRQVLWLREIADFSEADTAGILDISVGSVKTHLHHARKGMQELLRKDSATWEAEVR